MSGTPVLWDGFDMYNGVGANVGLAAKWTTFGSLLSTTGGRFGGQCIGILSVGSGASFTTNNYFYRGLPSAYSSFTVGFALYLDSLSNIGPYVAPLFMGLSSGTPQVSIGVDTVGKIHAFRSTGVQAGADLGQSAAATILLATWQYVEVEVVVSATVGRITVYVSGAQVLNLTGQNTQNAGVATVDTLYMMGIASPGQAGMHQYYDDLYFLDSASRLGEARVETLRPASDSIVTWTPNSGGNNYSRVNETLVDGDTSYVSTTTVGLRDLYTNSGLSSTPSVIYGVQLVTFGEKTDANTRTFFASLQSTGVDSDGSAFNFAVGYGRFDRQVLLDPATSAAWTASGVNNLLIGPKLAS